MNFELTKTEQFATCYALNRAGRMNKTITLPEEALPGSEYSWTGATTIFWLSAIPPA